MIGLYLNPPAHAAVFCVDEKTAIQALDRKDPVLPLSPGRAERHGFEYYRHGTLSLYAAFNTKTGEVLGKTAERHTSAEFVAFLTDIVVNQPKGKEIHVIADNLSAHKTKRVDAFLIEHRNVHLHFTPTYSSWLNQVELWFAKSERDVIARGVFTSVPDLKRKLMRYIRHYNKAPRTVKWKYFDPSRRISPESVVTVHYDVRARASHIIPERAIVARSSLLPSQQMHMDKASASRMRDSDCRPAARSPAERVRDRVAAATPAHRCADRLASGRMTRTQACGDRSSGAAG